MRNLAILALILATTVSAANAQSGSPNQYPKEAFGIMKDTATGKDIYYPTTYGLYRLDAGDVRTYNDTELLANLQLSNGITPVLILKPDYGVLKDLTVDSAEKLFGKPSFSGQSERVPSEGLFTFNLRGFGQSNEPNIYHIDFETGKNGKFKSYRVRGYEIPVASSQVGWQELISDELNSKREEGETPLLTN
jgi:hypothetical protein